MGYIEFSDGITNQRILQSPELPGNVRIELSGGQPRVVVPETMTVDRESDAAEAPSAP